jgi:hypothetical protein
MNLSRILATVCFLLVLPGLRPGLSAQNKGKCRWHDENIRTLTLADFDEKKNILYMLSNNGSYLFVNLKVPAAIEQKKILMFGLTTWIDLSGKSKKDIGIAFPYRVTNRRMRPQGPVPEWADSLLRPQQSQNQGPRLFRQAMFNFDEVKQDLVDRSRVIGLLNYSDTADLVLIPSDNLRDIFGWVTIDETGLMHCLVAIPFKKIPLQNADPKKGFSIGLETGFLNPEGAATGGPGAGRPGGMGRTGGPPGGGAGPPGGGRRGSSSGAGRPGAVPGDGTRPGGGISPQQREEMMQQRDALSAPTKFWIKGITLAGRPIPSDQE